MQILSEIVNKNVNIPEANPAIVTDHETLSYSQLENRTLSAAAYFRSIGIRRNTKVALLSSNCADYVINILAAWFLNSIVIPLNVRLSDNELSEIIKFSDAEFLLINKTESRNIPTSISQVDFHFAPHSKFTKSNQHKIDTENIALIMFTSGATGKPKGVMHSIRNLLNSADNSQSILSQNSKDKWLASLPFYHIGGLSIIIRSLRFGSVLIIPESLNNNDLKISFEKFNPSLASLVAAQLKRLLDSDWSPGKELRHLLLGGGFSDRQLTQKALSNNFPVTNVFGSTETSAFITANSMEGMKLKPSSAGHTLGDNKISIVDDKFKNLPVGSSGEIMVEGNTLFHGYYKEEETTRLKLRNGKFFTGDIGFIDEDGYLFIEARRNDLIVTGGENVNPLEVENLLNEIPEIIESCVFALPDEEWGQIVAAAIVLNEKISTQEMVEFMKGKIAGYKIPKRFFTVEKIPKSPLGKIMREKLKKGISSLS
jgi:O-succinylbenzoic acid--CoA ligase